MYPKILHRSNTETSNIEKFLQTVSKQLDKQKHTNKLIFERLSNLEINLNKVRN